MFLRKNAKGCKRADNWHGSGAVHDGFAHVGKNNFASWPGVGIASYPLDEGKPLPRKIVESQDGSCGSAEFLNELFTSMNAVGKTVYK